MKTMEKFSIQSLPEIIVASHREVLPDYAAIGSMCVEIIAPEMQRLGCKCPPPGYCFTVEHDREYKPTDVDIEYCEQVEEMGEDSAIIQFKRLPAVPKALCMKHVGPYERFYESYIEAFRYIEEHGYKPVGQFRTCYVDGVWNQEDPEKWLSIIQIPIECLS
jgi:effector-binding domain-containing protein